VLGARLGTRSAQHATSRALRAGVPRGVVDLAVLDRRPVPLLIRLVDRVEQRLGVGDVDLLAGEGGGEGIEVEVPAGGGGGVRGGGGEGVGEGEGGVAGG